MLGEFISPRKVSYWVEGVRMQKMSKMTASFQKRAVGGQFATHEGVMAWQPPVVVFVNETKAEHCGCSFIHSPGKYLIHA